MVFETQEIIFYGVCFVVSTFAGLARLWRDNDRVGWRNGLGRCLSSGFFSFGIVGIWAGRDPGSLVASGFFYLAIAAILGWMGKDLQDQILTRLVKFGLKKTGLDDDDSGKQ